MADHPAPVVRIEGTDVSTSCPMGRSLSVLHGYSRTSRLACPPAAVLVVGIPALIPKLIVQPGDASLGVHGNGEMRRLRYP